MTVNILGKMSKLYFEDDQSLGTKPYIASKQFTRLGQVPRPWLATLALAGTLSQPCSQGLIE